MDKLYTSVNTQTYGLKRTRNLCSELQVFYNHVLNFYPWLQCTFYTYGKFNEKQALQVCPIKADYAPNDGTPCCLAYVTVNKGICPFHS